MLENPVIFISVLGKSLGCYRYSADLFGIPSGNANSPATIDAVQEPGSSTLEEQCSALCFKEGYPFSAARRNAALENGAENPLLCLCGHDIDMPYLGGTCPQNDRTVISVYLHAPGKISILLPLQAGEFSAMIHFRPSLSSQDSIARHRHTWSGVFDYVLDLCCIFCLIRLKWNVAESASHS